MNLDNESKFPVSTQKRRQHLNEESASLAYTEMSTTTTVVSNSTSNSKENGYPKALISIGVLGGAIIVAFVIAKIVDYCYDRQIAMHDDVSDVSVNTRNLIRARVAVMHFRKALGAKSKGNDEDTVARQKKVIGIWAAKRKESRKISEQRQSEELTTKEAPKKSSIIIKVDKPKIETTSSLKDGPSSLFIMNEKRRPSNASIKSKTMVANYISAGTKVTIAGTKTTANSEQNTASTLSQAARQGTQKMEARPSNGNTAAIMNEERKRAMNMTKITHDQIPDLSEKIAHGHSDVQQPLYCECDLHSAKISNPSSGIVATVTTTNTAKDPSLSPSKKYAAFPDRKHQTGHSPTRPPSPVSVKPYAIVSKKVIDSSLGKSQTSHERPIQAVKSTKSLQLSQTTAAKTLRITSPPEKLPFNTVVSPANTQNTNSTIANQMLANTQNANSTIVNQMLSIAGLYDGPSKLKVHGEQTRNKTSTVTPTGLKT